MATGLSFKLSRWVFKGLWKTPWLLGCWTASSHDGTPVGFGPRDAFDGWMGSEILQSWMKIGPWKIAVTPYQSCFFWSFYDKTREFSIFRASACFNITWHESMVSSFSGGPDFMMPSAIAAMPILPDLVGFLLRGRVEMMLESDSTTLFFCDKALVILVI